jgi:flagellar assembly protein FliH
MPLMKAQSGSRVRQSAIVMDLSDLEREAGSILANARAEASRIIVDARTAAERVGAGIREEARQAGHRDGVASGLEEGRKFGHDEAVAQTAEKLAALLERWSKTLDVLQQHMPAHVADAKTDLVRLALAVAERVIHQEAIRDRKVAQSTVEETLRLIGSARKVVLRVHPDEMASLEKYLPDLIQKVRTIESADLVADENISPGGCEAQFGAGKVDARLETQIQRIADELLAGE